MNIYIIDEKPQRQAYYGWTEEKFDKHKGVLTRIVSKNQLFDDDVREDLKNADLIFFHESFYNNQQEDGQKYSDDKQQKIIDYIKEKGGGVFGGSIGVSAYVSNLVSLPVKLFYNNLSFLLCLNSLENWRETILYGNNPHVEKILKFKDELFSFFLKFDNNLNAEDQLGNNDEFLDKIEEIETFLGIENILLSSKSIFELKIYVNHLLDRRL